MKANIILHVFTSSLHNRSLIFHHAKIPSGKDFKGKKYIKIIYNITSYYHNDFNKFYPSFNVSVLDFSPPSIFFVCTEGPGDDTREQDPHGDEQLVDGDERAPDVRGSCFSNVNRYGHRGKPCRTPSEEYN